MGLQHMLAMIGGIITPPRLLANRGCLLGRDPALCAITPYLISSAMLASGLLTIIQILRIKLCGGYYLGTGLISVMGTSFTFLPIAREMVIRAITDAQAEGKCDCTPGTDAETGAATCGYPFDCKGYGRGPAAGDAPIRLLNCLRNGSVTHMAIGGLASFSSSPAHAVDEACAGCNGCLEDVLATAF